MFEIGDNVLVKTPNGEMAGRIKRVLPNYAWTDETKYEVSGKDLLTIVSARGLKRD